MTTSSDSIKIIQKLIKLLQSELAKTKKAKLQQDKSTEMRNLLNSIPGKDEQNLLVLNFTISSLEDILQTTSKLDVEDCDPTYENWMDLVLQYVKDFNKYGNCYIASCGEALLKTFGIKSYMRDGKPIFFRGEHNFGWNLLPRIVRKTGLTHNESQPFTVTHEELEFLKKFQKRHLKSNNKCTWQTKSQRDHFNWWSLMAHYDDEIGTRMIDITSSIFCGLYFACVDWDGRIDDTQDGCLYFLWNNNWRGDTATPEVRHGQIVGSDDLKQNSAAKYYTVQKNPTTIRFRESPGSNDRLIYQDGYFLWWPHFGEPLDLGQKHMFRVHKSAKLTIIRELYSVGYTATRIVRGEKGKDAHNLICRQLGINP